MDLFFFRHGIAEDRDGQKPDSLRELTAEGIERLERAAPVVKRLGIKPDRVYSSPLVRARQTAEIVAKALGVSVEIREEVAPGFSATDVEKLIADLGVDASVMFFGHEPDFSETITALVGGRVQMKKGGLVCVELISRKPLMGELAYALSPKVFNKLG